MFEWAGVPNSGVKRNGGHPSREEAAVLVSPRRPWGRLQWCHQEHRIDLGSDPWPPEKHGQLAAVGLHAHRSEVPAACVPRAVSGPWLWDRGVVAAWPGGLGTLQLLCVSAFPTATVTTPHQLRS